jgi:hypothetical protein
VDRELHECLIVVPGVRLRLTMKRTLTIVITPKGCDKDGGLDVE